ncbi:head-tail joining protein [Achromobacter aegrifaciens]
MEWDNSVFNEAFDAVGLREPALLLDTEPPTGFQVRLNRPQVIDGEMVHSTDYEIEYTTADVPGLTYHSRIQIDQVEYRVRQQPTAVGDGYWSLALLEVPQ